MQVTQPIEIVATVLFAIALVHTFMISFFRRIGSRFQKSSRKYGRLSRVASILGRFFGQLFGDVELIFGFWAGVLLILFIFFAGGAAVIQYMRRLSFTEPLFVFAIMIVAATRPIIYAAKKLILAIADKLPLGSEMGIYFTTLVLGPLLGSFITEPAAMTITATLLRDRYFSKTSDMRFKYLTLAVLFVNISIGGVLTHFAAPPVLMVANTWNWNTSFMFMNFGWKAVVAVILNAGIASYWNRITLSSGSNSMLQESLANTSDASTSNAGPPQSLIGAHLVFLVMIVITAHYPVVFLGLLLVFLGMTTVTKKQQDDLEIRQGFLVALFLSGLVVLGGLQGWWLDPLLRGFDSISLFLGAATLTAVIDNAALTYLGSQVDWGSELFKYALVAGAVAGGGLTVIANAPNPAGYLILQSHFGSAGIQAIRLFQYAFIPTVVCLIIFWVL